HSAVTLDQGRAYPHSAALRLPRLHVGRHAPPSALRAFVVPTIGPTYRVLNGLIHGLLRRPSWPRPLPGTVQSTQVQPIAEAQ
ncbi:MAG: hypothetical protein M3Z04_13145, partial [Chloroflexota bacterium]|nr:hypothetical protein [Chloroflexota bacterium]